MKNVYDFVKILETAHGEAVQGWKEVDLQNAYKWADFCVQVRCASPVCRSHIDVSTK